MSLIVLIRKSLVFLIDRSTRAIRTYHKQMLVHLVILPPTPLLPLPPSSQLPPDCHLYLEQILKDLTTQDIVNRI